MYLGRRKEKFQYEMVNSRGSHVLSESFQEKDLGVMITSDMKWNKQCSYAAAKANRVLRQIKNSFRYLGHETLKPLYTALVRPHLEYAVCSWCPYFKTDIKILERVQRRATKLVKPIKSKPYEVRLKELNLMSLEDRRRRGDLIQMHKLVNGHEDINLLSGINFAKPTTINLRRQHKKRLIREINKKGSHRYNFFTNRVTSSWNDLPESAVSATSTNIFKNIIDEKVFGMTRSKCCQSPFKG